MSGNQRRHGGKKAIAKVAPSAAAAKAAITQTPEAAVIQSADTMFAAAVGHHAAGREVEAELLYRAILSIPPVQAETAYNLGLIYQTNKS